MIELRRNTATKQQLASDYGVSVRTINKWMKLAKINVNGILYPTKLQEFYSKIGAPMGENYDN